MCHDIIVPLINFNNYYFTDTMITNSYILATGYLHLLSKLRCLTFEFHIAYCCNCLHAYVHCKLSLKMIPNIVTDFV